MEERIQKILSRAGLGSRRACEELIAAGRVSVNGRTAQVGDKADPETDRITVDGRPVSVSQELMYIALYKPRGVISAVTSPDRRQTVRDLVPMPGQLVPVGRLDVDSEGLILLTNDGELTNRLTHPRYGHEKEYRVLVARRPDEEQLQAWRRGVVLEDGYQTQPAEVQYDSTFGKGAWLRVQLREGRKRQIRETGQRIGLPVVRIIRIRIGSLVLGTLKPREWRHLTSQEVADLRSGKPPRLAKPASDRRRSEKREGSNRPAPRRTSGARPGGGGRSSERGGTPRRSEPRPDAYERSEGPPQRRSEHEEHPSRSGRGPGGSRTPRTGGPSRSGGTPRPGGPPRTGRPSRPGGPAKPGRPSDSERGGGSDRPSRPGKPRGAGRDGGKGGRRPR